MIFVGLAGLEMICPVGEEPVWPAGAGAGGEVPHAVRPEREEQRDHPAQDQREAPAQGQRWDQGARQVTRGGAPQGERLIIP